MALQAYDTLSYSLTAKHTSIDDGKVEEQSYSWILNVTVLDTKESIFYDPNRLACWKRSDSKCLKETIQL